MSQVPRSTRFHQPHLHLAGAFGSSRFGQLAEVFARAFGTPVFLATQTVIVIAWIIFNAARTETFDPYPFILLNLGFSLQAAYAAPLILLAQTRQSDRDRAWSTADADHREALAATTLALLDQNTALTQQVADLSRHIDQLTAEIHGRIIATSGG